VASGVNLTLGSISDAVTILGGVRVVRLELDGVALGISEGPSLVTTVATEVEGGAVNELLLGERKEFTSQDLVSTLHSTRGGERPAGTALTLILNGGDGTLGSPVLGQGVGLRQVGGLHVVFNNDGTEHLSVFFVSKIRKVVVTVGGGGLSGVELSNGGINLHESVVSELELGSGTVGEVVQMEPLYPVA